MLRVQEDDPDRYWKNIIHGGSASKTLQLCEKAQIFEENDDNLLPVEMAALEGKIAIANFLKTEMRQTINSYKNRSLVHSIETENFDRVKLMVEIGADVCRLDGFETPLCKAISTQNIELVKYMLDNGAKYTVHTAIFHAVEIGNLQIVKMLVENGANYNRVDRHGQTPLTKAIECNHKKIHQYFLSLGGRNTIDDIGIGLLMEKIKIRDLKAVKSLVSNNVKINLPDSRGDYPLNRSIRTGDFAIFKYLVESGANVGAVDNEGDFPLLECIRQRDLRMFQFLVEHKADPNQKDQHKRTLFQIAIRHKHLGITQYLMNLGVKMDNAAQDIQEFARSNEDFQEFLDTRDRTRALLPSM